MLHGREGGRLEVLVAATLTADLGGGQVVASMLQSVAFGCIRVAFGCIVLHRCCIVKHVGERST